VSVLIGVTRIPVDDETTLIPYRRLTGQWGQQVPVFAVDPRNSDHVRWMIGTVIAMANQSHQSEELIVEKS